MKALILDADVRSAQVRTIPIPEPSVQDILVRVHVVALNPVDALYTFNPLGKTGRVVGSDFSGAVVKVGSQVPSSSNLTEGSRVAGFLQGACSVNDRPGAFAEYLVIPWDLVWRVPCEMSLESAAAVSLCGLTAAQGLFFRLGLPAPFWRFEDSERRATHDLGGDKAIRVLVYGASTNVGLYTAQLIRLSGLVSGTPIRLIGVASSARHAMLMKKPYEYDSLVDYRSKTWLSQVSEFCEHQGVDYAIDCISEGTSVSHINTLLGSNGKQAIYRSRAGGAWTSQEPLRIEPIYGAVWEGLGVKVEYQGFTVPASSEARKFAVAFYKFLSLGAETGGAMLEPNPVRLMPGGLERIVNDGFTLLGPQKMDDRAHQRKEEYMAPVSAEKLVYKLPDLPQGFQHRTPQ